MASTKSTYWSLFFAPMYYNFSIRLKRVDKIFSWLFINLLPTFFYALYTAESVDFKSVGSVCILWLVVYTLYEFGYIYNDVRAIQSEQNPTLRLSDDQLAFARRYLGLIFMSRLLVFVSGLAVIYSLLPTINTLITIGLACACPLLFFAYNSWRSEQNVWLYFWLVVSRFLPFAFLFESENATLLISMLVLIYPLEISIERFSRPQKRFSLVAKVIPTEESKPKFRVYYYAFCCVLLGLLSASQLIDVVLIVPFFLFLFYRVTLRVICC